MMNIITHSLTSVKFFILNQLDYSFSSSGLADKDNMNSDSANKAHNKVNTLCRLLLETQKSWICAGSAKKFSTATQSFKWALPTRFREPCLSSRHTKHEWAKLTTNILCVPGSLSLSWIPLCLTTCVRGCVCGQGSYFTKTKNIEREKTVNWIPVSENCALLHTFMSVNEPECQYEFWRCVRVFRDETSDDSQLWSSVVMLMPANACTQKKGPICPISMPCFVVFSSSCVCVHTSVLFLCF